MRFYDPTVFERTLTAGFGGPNGTGHPGLRLVPSAGGTKIFT